MNIDLKELSEYIRNVDPVPCAIKVPKLPIYKENHLNFLKPGSKEVVTRPMYVHEHLPPMHPEIKGILNKLFTFYKKNKKIHNFLFIIYRRI